LAPKLELLDELKILEAYCGLCPDDPKVLIPKATFPGFCGIPVVLKAIDVRLFMMPETAFYLVPD
jgi:hypothetical protein